MPFLIQGNFLPLPLPTSTLLITQFRRANSKRAFQSVPRSMRRRTASHNVKRVPKRLRNRHAKEMADDNTPTVTSRRRKPTSHLRLRLETAKRLRALSQRNPKQGEAVQEKAKLLHNQIPLENVLQQPPAPKSKFRKRQIHKTWLPTHIWHAKRAHMVVRWMYAIAESPTEKCFRSIHRSSTLRGAVAWDHSYYGTIFIKGKEKEIAAALKEVLGPQDAEIVAGKGLIRKGKRSWQGWVYEQNSYPTKPIAPVLLLWCNPSPLKDSSEPEMKVDSKILIRIHPSAFLQLWMTILSIKKQYKSLIAEDLRFEIGSIEVCGPAATDALIASLQPRENPTSPELPEDVWVNLRSLTNTSSLPPGAFLAFNVMDPRIRFPPQLPSLSRTEGLREERLFSTLSTWPVDQKPYSPSLFSREARFTSIRGKSSQRNINKRKEETTPGELPRIISTDPYIPVILIANRNSPLVHSKKFSAATSKAIGSWTVLLPWKWVLPVWYSLLHFPSVRFGGISEAKQIQYENSVGSFPDDFPGTKAGLEEEERKATVRKQTWERRPKQKRTAWESVNLGEGRKGELGRGTWCDWEYLTESVLRDSKITADIQNETDSLSKSVGISSTASHTACTLQHEPMNLSPPTPHAAAQIPLPIPIPSTTTLNTSLPSQITTSPFHLPSSPWMVPSSLVLPTLFQPHAPLQSPLSNFPPEVLAKAFFSVKIVFLNRGAPGERARIYQFPSKAHAQRNPLTRKLRDGWTNLLESHEEYEASKSRYQKPEILHHQRHSQGQGQLDPGASQLHRNTLPTPLRHHHHHYHHPPQPPLQPGHEGYPSVPGEEDLIGFVTSGNFNLKEGRGTGIAALSFARVFSEFVSPVEGKGCREPLKRVCVVRDVGEQVGRLARWEVIN